MRARFAVPALLFVASNAVAESLADATLADRLVDLEKQSWVAWQGHDAAYFAGFLCDDHKVESYAVDSFKLTRIAEDTALLTYRAEQKTTCGGYPVPSPAWASSLYVKRGARWVNVLYQRTPAT